MSLRLDGDGGSVTISDSVLAQIVQQAAESVEGARVRRARRHLDVEVEDGRARVDLELAIRYGRVLPEAARDVQREVANAVGTMCGVEVVAVDVSIEELDE